MPIVEAVLVYRPHGVRSEHAVPVGATDDPAVLRQLRDRLIRTAEEEVAMWRAADPGLALMRQAEAERLKLVLGFLLSDQEFRPDLRLVQPSRPGESDRT